MIKNKINTIIAETVFYEGVLDSSVSLKSDLGIDSLNLVELIVKLEDAFNIQFNESDLDPENMQTVYDIYQLISKYVEVDYDI